MTISAVQVCRWLEIIRWVGVTIGFVIADVSGRQPATKLHIVAPWLVLSLNGLTGLEALAFGNAAASRAGAVPGLYQRQSGFTDLALAATFLLATLFGWGLPAEVTLVTVLAIFLVLSATDYLRTAARAGRLRAWSFLLPAATAALLAGVVPWIAAAARTLPQGVAGP